MLNKIVQKKLNKTTECRLCKSKRLYAFLNLGKIPITNELKKNKINSRVKFPTLKILVCLDCWHVQSGQAPISSKVYRNHYSYHTRFIETIKKHFKTQAKKIIKEFKLSKKDLIIDIGGNDGTFLKHFKDQINGIKTLCIEPNLQTSAHAKRIGIRIFQDFFNYKNSDLIKKKYGTPKIILCTNSFGNIDDLNNFVSALENIMDDESTFIFENPYLVDTIKNFLFDTMYYEHVSYFSISPLIKFFLKYNLQIFNYRKSNVHGGSIMFFVRKIKNTNKFKKIENAILYEKKFGLQKIKTYQQFSIDVNIIKNKLIKVINKLKKNKKKIVAYGASDRGIVLLNFCGINDSHIDYLVDANPFKHNFYYSGTNIKIFNIKRLIFENPDYILIVAWNFKKEIIKNLKKLNIKTKFIIPLPKPIILN
jgi:hypothetical protein